MIEQAVAMLVIGGLLFVGVVWAIVAYRSRDH